MVRHAPGGSSLGIGHALTPDALVTLMAVHRNRYPAEDSGRSQVEHMPDVAQAPGYDQLPPREPPPAARCGIPVPAHARIGCDIDGCRLARIGRQRGPSG